MARKKKRKTKGGKKSAARKNHIPLEILEKRAGKLIRLVHRRGGEPS
jgi:hypothetical protein